MWTGATQVQDWKRNFVLLLVLALASLWRRTCEPGRRNAGTQAQEKWKYFLSADKQTNASSPALTDTQDADGIFTCVWPCAYAHITHVNVSVLMLASYVWTSWKTKVIASQPLFGSSMHGAEVSTGRLNQLLRYCIPGFRVFRLLLVLSIT